MANRRESKGFVQLEWICPNCNGHNPGPVKTCNNCGAPQPENVQFQRAADEKIITDAKTAEAANAGADIHCGFCGTRNPATARICSQCGGDLKEGKARQAGQALQAAPTGPKVVTCTNCGTENPGSARVCKQCGSPLPQLAAPTVQQSNPIRAQASSRPAAAQQKRPNWLLFGGIGAFLLLCCMAVLFLFVFPSKSVQGTVTDVQWQTSVPVQEVQAVNYSDQSGSAPSDAYNVSCRTEDQEVCEDKTIDKGNGYAEVVKECHTESQQYCDYTVDEWTTIQTYPLQGNDFSPIYESPSLSNGQKIGSTSEQLTVYFNTADGQETYSPGSESEFQQFQIGTAWTLKMNALGSVISVGK
jgi:ribosomal protein L40E